MTRTPQSRQLVYLQAALGHKPLRRSWAKAEISLGLASAGVGLLLSTWAMRASAIDWLTMMAGLLLFVLGGYLALAGSRSHLYQSNNELTAFLLEELHRLHDKG